MLNVMRQTTRAHVTKCHETNVKSHAKCHETNDKSHAKCHETNDKKKRALKSFLTQRTFAVDDGTPNLSKDITCILSAEEVVRKAEVLDALYVVRAIHSFASTNGNAERYWMMFGES